MDMQMCKCHSFSSFLFYFQHSARILFGCLFSRSFRFSFDCLLLTSPQAAALFFQQGCDPFYCNSSVLLFLVRLSCYLSLYLEIKFFSTVSRMDKGQVFLISRNPAHFHLSLHKQFRVGITDCSNTARSLQSPSPHHFRLR